MFWETIDAQLQGKDFQPVQGRSGWYFRMENPVLYFLCLLDGRGENIAEESRLFTQYSKGWMDRLSEFHCTRLVALSVLVEKEDNFSVETVEDGENGFCGIENYYRVFWHFSTEAARVRAGEGQPNRLIGIEKLLAAAARGVVPEELFLRDEAQQSLPLASIIIFAICAALLVWMTFSGQRTDIILDYGLGAEGIRNGEYYRFLTSMFLHSGMMHLASNGVYLYYFGVRSEKLLGTGRFLLLYLFSGFCGGLFSVLLGDGWNVSIGASGAIYGLLGAMLLLTRKRGSAYTGMSYSTMLLLAATAIGMGFLETGVDNMGHIGGFLGGMGMFALLLRK